MNVHISLAKLDPRQSKIVELRFFGGLTVEKTAEVLGISPKTVKRDWECGQGLAPWRSEDKPWRHHLRNGKK
jgi:DNA-binding transcriptional regulator YiaG